jgi:tetratricopeptide (TPR) repeat protein
MPNNINDPLFLLIKSLAGAEKRHFKLYISRNQANEEAKFVKLFDALESSREYNEEQILKKCPTIARQQLPNIKAHLYGELLTALRLLHSVKNMEIQIREQIDFAKILYNRGLILQALKILDKAKNLAKSNSHFILTLEILQFEKDIESRHITRSLKGRAGALIDETNFIIKQINEVTHLSNVALRMYELYLENGHVTDEAHSVAIEKIFRENIAGINEAQISFFGKVYLHQSYCWYYIIQLDFTKYYWHAEKWVHLFEEHPEVKKEDPFLYVKAMHNLLNALFIIGRHKKMVEELQQLEEFYSIAGAFNENLEIQTFVYLFTAKINLHFLEGTFTEGLSLVKPIEEKLKQYQQYIDTHRALVFYYKIASLYFGSGDSENAIVYLSRIINLKVGQLRTDIQCFARLLHLIAHYELGNMELVEYLIKSVYRFLSKMENLDAVLAEIFTFLRRSLSSKQRDVKKSFIQLRDTLETISTSKYNRRSYQYLDIVSWLDSKIEGVPVQDIIKSKFKLTVKVH